MSKVIINADDFGLSDGICKSIIELLEVEAISSTTLMICADGAKNRCREWGGKSLLGKAGTHLQLTAGRPISPPDDIPSLINPQTGSFWKTKKELLAQSVKLSEVAMEWLRQIHATCDLLNGLPTHLDSHHGVHLIPGFTSVYVALAEIVGTPVRGSNDGFIKEEIEKENIEGTTFVIDDWTGKSLGPEELKKTILNALKKNPNKKAIELITHPGYSDNYLRTISSFSDLREDEHKTLLTLAQSSWLREEGITISSHKSIFNSAPKKK